MSAYRDALVKLIADAEAAEGDRSYVVEAQEALAAADKLDPVLWELAGECIRGFLMGRVPWDSLDPLTDKVVAAVREQVRR